MFDWLSNLSANGMTWNPKDLNPNFVRFLGTAGQNVSNPDLNWGQAISNTAMSELQTKRMAEIYGGQPQTYTMSKGGNTNLQKQPPKALTPPPQQNTLLEGATDNTAAFMEAAKQITPVGVAGADSVTMNADGIVVKYPTPSNLNSFGTKTPAQNRYAPETPAQSTMPTSQNAIGRSQNNASPFFKALLA